MTKIIHKEALNDLVWRYRLHAPRIAKKRQAGQFIILRVAKDGERVPLTISNSNPKEGWIEIIFQPVGASTKTLAQLNEGDTIADLVGPLGKPTHIKKFGRCVCIGGGVGVAPLYPIVKALKEAGNDVTTIIGARNKSLLILEKDMQEASTTLLVATDDGSYGHHGFVSDLLKQALAKGEHFDYAIIIGPPMMMKVVSEIAINANIPTYVSLNPIMIDGTGMCGGCRVNINGKTFFACVDGPEFEAKGIDWNSMIKRLINYSAIKTEPGHICHLTSTSTASVSHAKGKRTPMREQTPEARKKNFQDVTLGYSPEEAQQEAKRCLNCKHSPCVKGCPIGVKIPEFVKLVAEGKFVDAGLKIKESHLFPSICGRVCPQESQCEKNCVLAKAGSPIAIGSLERFAGDYFQTQSETKDLPIAKSNGKKVAVVGTGPASLTVASELVQKGFDITMFEALHELGGVLTYGIPDFRLPKTILQKELGQLEKYGVKVVRNFIVGKTATIDDLFKEDKFDAVFVGTGAGLPVFMNIPGEHSTGVYAANEYLTRVNLMRAHMADAKTPIMRGENVVVVGGGNVAMDAARTAVRLGAKKVTLVYRRSESEMPARLEEVRHAKEEGIEFQMLTNPVEVIADEKTWVKALRCVKMQLGEPDASGRRGVDPIPGSEFDIPCEVVIVAIGNRSNPLIQSTTPDLQVTPKGTLTVPNQDGRTSKKFVYAGGDVVTGAATVILAIAAGKKASQSIIEDLL